MTHRYVIFENCVEIDENSKFDPESPEDQFSGALHVYKVDCYDGNIRSPSEMQYEVKTSFCHGISVVKQII